MDLNSEIYIDKSELIKYTNKVLDSGKRFICVSRPRRFGKSMTANMLSAYYTRTVDFKTLFSNLKIAQDKSFDEYINKYDVIFLNMQEFLSESNCIDEMLNLLQEGLFEDFFDVYPNIKEKMTNSKSLLKLFRKTYNETNVPFVVIIDEWDCIFREYKDDKEGQKKYLDFLRNLLKDKDYIGLAYMTGILPIKKYGTHSAINMFDEFSMLNPRELSEFVGFTENEVKTLCKKYSMDFLETKSWYDGYYLKKVGSIYSPRSVVTAMTSGEYDNYWNQTETFEALKIYINMNLDGLKDIITKMVAGDRIKVNTNKFTNDMTNLVSIDNICTLLIHLGYLAYDFDKKEAFIPNKEIAQEYINAIEDSNGWEEIVKAINSSEKLLNSVWNMDEKKVAKGIEKAHNEIAHIQYNNENSLSCVISLAFYTARQYYTIVRELPSGEGYADIVCIPRNKYLDKPALVIELKYDKTAKGAIEQIKSRHYIEALKEYEGNILLVGINYVKKEKKHECIIEQFVKETIIEK